MENVLPFTVRVPLMTVPLKNQVPPDALQPFVPEGVHVHDAPAANWPVKEKPDPVTVIFPPALKVALGLNRNPVAFVPVMKETDPRQPVAWQAE
jgi:hypothetical protein